MDTQLNCLLPRLQDVGLVHTPYSVRDANCCMYLNLYVSDRMYQHARTRSNNMYRPRFKPLIASSYLKGIFVIFAIYLLGIESGNEGNKATKCRLTDDGVMGLGSFAFAAS